MRNNHDFRAETVVGRMRRSEHAANFIEGEFFFIHELEEELLLLGKASDGLTKFRAGHRPGWRIGGIIVGGIKAVGDGHESRKEPPLKPQVIDDAQGVDSEDEGTETSQLRVEANEGLDQRVRCGHVGITEPSAPRHVGQSGVVALAKDGEFLSLPRGEGFFGSGFLSGHRGRRIPVVRGRAGQPSQRGRQTPPRVMAIGVVWWQLYMFHNCVHFAVLVTVTRPSRGRDVPASQAAHLVAKDRDSVGSDPERGRQ